MKLKRNLNKSKYKRHLAIGNKWRLKHRNLKDNYNSKFKYKLDSEKESQITNPN